MDKYKIIKRKDVSLIKNVPTTPFEDIIQESLRQHGKKIKKPHCKICLDTLDDIDLYDIEGKIICVECFELQTHMYEKYNKNT
jgi:hypothetical protein